MRRFILSLIVLAAFLPASALAHGIYRPRCCPKILLPPPAPIEGSWEPTLARVGVFGWRWGWQYRFVPKQSQPETPQ